MDRRQEQQGWVQKARSALLYLQSGWRGKLLTAFLLLLSLVVVGSVLVANWSSLREYIWHVRLRWLVYALLLMALALFLSALTWHVLVARFTGYRHVGRNMKIWSYANLAKRIPSPIWYIGSRALLYEKRGLSKTTISLLSTLELILIILSATGTFLLTLPFWAVPPDLGRRLGASWFVLLLLPLCLVLVHPRILQAIWHRFGRHELPERLRWRDSAFWLALYLLIWLIGSAILFSVVNMFNPLPLSQFIPIVGIWVVANTLSLVGTLTLTGIGVREISLTVLLGQILPIPLALVIAIVVRLVWMGGELGGALLSLLYRPQEEVS